MSTMTEEHKKALAKGRRQARAVKSYLEALNTETPKHDEESLRKRLQKVEQQIGDEDNPARRVELVQQRLELEMQLNNLEEAPDLEVLEKDFKSVVRDYSERKGISYKAWREVGVPAGVLREAGMKRGG